MQTSTPAARRFFRAFYAWTRSTCVTHTTPSGVPRCHLHHGSRQLVNPNYFNAFDKVYRPLTDPGAEHPKKPSQPTTRKTQRSSKTRCSKRWSGQSPVGPAQPRIPRTSSRETNVHRAVYKDGNRGSKKRAEQQTDVANDDAIGSKTFRIVALLDMQTLKHAHIAAEEEVPFSAIPPLQGVIRSRRDGITEVECAVPLPIFEALENKDILPSESVQEIDNARMEFRDEGRVIEANEEESLAGTVLRSLRVSGSNTSLFAALFQMKGLLTLFENPIEVNLSYPASRPALPGPITIRERTASSVTWGCVISQVSWSHPEAKSALQSMVAAAGLTLRVRDVYTGDVSKHRGQPCHGLEFSGPIDASVKALYPLRSLLRGIEEGHFTSSAVKLREGARSAFRLLAQPVVLVTSSTLEESTSDPQSLASFSGMTVSSFSVVTLEPSPVISFNVKLPSRTMVAMRSSRHIRVHILDATPKGAVVAHTFAQSYKSGDEPFHRLTQLGFSVHPQPRPYAPLVAPEGGVLAHLSAQVVSVHHVRDHAVVSAEVLECHSLHSDQDDLAGLSYAARSYRERGKEIRIPLTPHDASPPSSSRNRSEGASDDAFAIKNVRQNTALSGSIAQHRGAAVQALSTFQTRAYSTDASRFKHRDRVEPSSRKMTVADFFNLPDENDNSWRFPYTKSLIRADKTVQSATQRLRRAMEPGGLFSHREIEELEETIRVNQREIDMRLSRSSARSLRRMLDKGRVNFKLAQWLESSIERGQVVLEDDLQQVEELFRQRRIDKGKYNSLKRELEDERDALVTETMRLRQIVDEEGDGPAYDSEDD